MTLAAPAGTKWAKLYWHLPPGLIVKSGSATLVKAGVPLQVRGRRLLYSVTKVSKKGGELWLKLASPQKSMTISISSGFLTYNAQGLALLRAGTYKHGEVVPVVLKLTTTKGKTVTVQLRVALP